MTEQHRKDYEELVELVKNHNVVELKNILNITSEDDELFDFHYKSFLATIVYGNPPYLSGICSLDNGDETWEDYVRMSDSVDVCGLSYADIVMLTDKFERQVKEKGVVFLSEDDETGCRLDFMDQYERYGIENPQIRLM